MRIRAGFLLVAIGLLWPQPGRATDTLGALLLGSNEVPGPGTGGGCATAILAVDRRKVRFSILFDDSRVVTGMHVHHAAAGLVGETVMDLGAGEFSRASSETRIVAELAAALVANPKDYYIDVHTPDFPNGACRGQLVAAPPPAALAPDDRAIGSISARPGGFPVPAGAPSSGKPARGAGPPAPGVARGFPPDPSTWVGEGLGAVLLASKEVPGPGMAGASGRALFVVDGTTLHLSLTLEGFRASTGVHVHKGRAGASGPVVLDFHAGPSVGMNGGAIVDAKLAADLIAKPQDYYIDVHTEEYPDGACRGQLARAARPAADVLPGDREDDDARPESGAIGSRRGPRDVQEIRFSELSTRFYGDGDFRLYASATSGLPVSFTATGSCTVSGSTVHILSAGKCWITAHQPGDSRFDEAPDVEERLTISKAGQSISFAPPSGRTYLDPDFALDGSASSGLAVVFLASGDCSVRGPVVHVVAAGTCWLTAHQPGDANFTAASIVDAQFPIAKAEQTIDFPEIPSLSVGLGYSVGAVATSRLPVSFSTAGVCWIAGSSLQFSSSGTCTVIAQQPGDANFNPAPSVEHTFEILGNE